MRKHFVVPGLQYDEHDKREGKNDICNHKGVGENVEGRAGLDVDGYGLVKLLSKSKHTHKAQNQFCNCRVCKRDIQHHGILFRISHTSFHPWEHGMCCEAEYYDAKANQEGVQLETWHVVATHLVVLRNTIDDDCQDCGKEGEN